MAKSCVSGILLFMAISVFGQPYPESADAADKRMLVTFGGMSGDQYAEAYMVQSVYFALPEHRKEPFFVRLFDPDCGGELDLIEGHWETNTLFEIYGGEGCLTFPSASDRPAGKLLDKNVYARESLVDHQWVSLGPFTATDGESVDEYPGYVFFRLFIRGRTGDDGNLFSVFLSESDNENLPLHGGTVFQFKSAMVDNGKLAIRTFHQHEQQDNLFSIPVDLDPITPEREISITADPIDH